MNFRRGQRREDPEINLIPMIDILLVIVIFLMVSSTFVHQRGLNIQLPQGSRTATEAIHHDVIEVQIAKNKQALVNQKPWNWSEADLPTLLAYKEVPRGDTTIMIAADKELTHGDVMQVIADFQRLGFTRFSLITEDKTP